MRIAVSVSHWIRGSTWKCHWIRNPTRAVASTGSNLGLGAWGTEPLWGSYTRIRQTKFLHLWHEFNITVRGSGGGRGRGGTNCSCPPPHFGPKHIHKEPFLCWTSHEQGVKDPSITPVLKAFCYRSLIAPKYVNHIPHDDKNPNFSWKGLKSFCL